MVKFIRAFIFEVYYEKAKQKVIILLVIGILLISSFFMGFIGMNTYGKIENCYFGEVNNASATSVNCNNQVGGFVGLSIGTTITNCINYGTIQCAYYEDLIPYAGGLAGVQSAGAKIVNSSNVGTVQYIGAANSDKSCQPRMGQLIGFNESGCSYDTKFVSNIGTVDSCQGEVNKGNLKKVGGFLGIGQTDQAKYVSSSYVGEQA